MPAEPSSGTTVVVTLEDGSRLTRKFAPHSRGDWVYCWVINESCKSGNKLSLDNFELVLPVGSGSLDRNAFLDDQGISGRTMLRVRDIS